MLAGFLILIERYSQQREKRQSLMPFKME